MVKMLCLRVLGLLSGFTIKHDSTRGLFMFTSYFRYEVVAVMNKREYELRNVWEVRKLMSERMVFLKNLIKEDEVYLAMKVDDRYCCVFSEQYGSVFNIELRFEGDNCMEKVEEFVERIRLAKEYGLSIGIHNVEEYCLLKLNTILGTVRKDASREEFEEKVLEAAL